MRTLTTTDVQYNLDNRAEIPLFWHTEGNLMKSLGYNFQTGVYTITIGNRIGTTKDMKDAVNRYNDGEAVVSQTRADGVIEEATPVGRLRADKRG